MSGMGSHDIRAERRHRIYLCNVCGKAHDHPNDAIDCEEGHEQ